MLKRPKRKRRPRVIYHWSPRKNRGRILREGLRINEPTRGGLDWKRPHICFSDNPGSAWFYVVGIPRGTILDLYMVQTHWRDRGSWRADGVNEFRIRHDIPRERVWWIGERRVGWNPPRK